MKTVTINEYLTELREKEAKMAEKPFFTDKLTAFCEAVEKIDKDKIVIKTDYDADGICSAYILSETLEALFPKKEVKVLVNDRRGAYGDIGGEPQPDAQVFVLDMGSNEIEAIEKNYPGAFIIDHHLTQNIVEMQGNPKYVNPKTFPNGGEYCTTGLAYRIWEILSERNESIRDEVRHNTLTAMAGIGTVADVVDLMDENSYNRQIVKKSIACINNATMENFNPVIGYFLQNACPNINGEEGKDVSATDYGMSIAPFINGAGRMSELIGGNGSQEVFNCLKKPNPLLFARLNEYNALRKEYGRMVKTDSKILSYMEQNLDTFKVNVFVIPDIPHSLCGIVAGNLCENLDAPVICLTYNPKSNTYSGSARNSKYTSSLKEFTDKAVSGMDIQYGGHHDAMGISRLKAEDLPEFLKRIEDANEKHPILREDDNILILDMTLSELEEKKDEVAEFLKEAEPMSLPIYLKLATEGRSKGRMISNVKSWKDVQFKDGDTKFYVKDWSYCDKTYETPHVLAKISLETYGKEPIALTKSYCRVFEAEERKQMLLNPPPVKPKKATKTKTKDDSSDTSKSDPPKRKFHLNFGKP